MKKHLPLVFVPLAIAWVLVTLNVAERAALRSHVQNNNVQFVK